MKEMEHHSNPLAALLYTVVSFTATIFAWVTIKDVQIMAGICASLVAIVSGSFAIRYYYYSTKKVKDDFKKK